MAASPSSPSLDRLVADAGERLQRSLGALISHYPEAAERPMGLAKTLGCHKDLSSRVHRALAKEDALAVVYHLPGPSALRDLVLRVKKGGRAASEELTEATQAIDQYDDLIRAQAGDQSTLDGMISAWLPEARAKHELAGKQAMYRGVRSLTGIAVKTMVCTQLVTPCQDGDHVTMANMEGFLGLRRLREDATLRIGNWKYRDPEKDRPGGWVSSVDDLEEIDLSEFHSGSSSAVVDREAGQGHGLTHVLHSHAGIGNRRRSDILFGQLKQCAAKRKFKPGAPQQVLEKKPPSSFSQVITVPAERMVFDLLLHGELPTETPQAVVTETAGIGPLLSHGPMTDLFKLPSSATVEESTTGIAGLRIANCSRYLDVLDRLCQKAHCDPGELRAFRMSVDFPVYSAQYHMMCP